VAHDGAGRYLSATVAFITPGTPIEQAWADLCDERENALADRVATACGGWDAWCTGPVTYGVFVALCNSESVCDEPHTAQRAPDGPHANAFRAIS
jgi:hypothetical protein